jgi:maltose O-acetyltransferase
MTEWNKMQAHQICNDFDADLFERRVKAKKLFKEREFEIVINIFQ